MLVLHRSNDPSRLHAAVADALRARAARAGGLGLLDPVRVVVPSAGVREALSFEVARRLGIEATLRPLFLDDLVAELARAGQPASARLVDREALRVALFDALAPVRLEGDPALAPFARYLASAGPAAAPAGPAAPDPEAAREEADAALRRRSELAARLADRFDAYAQARPELLAAWEADAPAPLPPGTSHAETEPGQRRLWRALFGPGGPFARPAGAPGEGAWLAPHRLLEAPPPADPGELHVVALGHVAPLHRRLLVRLAKAGDLHVHLVTPSASPAATHPADARWGGLGRAHEALWRAAAAEEGVAVVDDDRFAPPAGASLLARLQRDVLAGRAPADDGAAAGAARPADDAAGDASLEVHACRGPRRELEAVADAIWAAVHATPADAPDRLRFDEVAVVVPDGAADAYARHAAAAFAAAHDLPLQGGAATSRLVEAALLLVDLPLGPCRRDQLLRVLTHPALAGGAPEVDPADWLRWADEAAILRGVDRAELAGTYVARDLHSWDQGLRRLGLGAYVAGGRSGADAPVRLGSDDYLPLETAGDARGSAGVLATLARGLLADVAFARTAAATLTGWAGFLHALLTAYLTPADDAERVLLGRAAYAARSLEALDLGAPVPYRLAADLVRARLEALAPAAEERAERGVVVAPLARLRGRAFRLVAFVGLGEASLPATDARDVLDLRQAAPAAGDAGARDRDHAALLEVLTTTRERLLLTWVARDPVTGDELAPSPVVDALERVARETGLAPRLRRVEHPLRRWAAPAGALPEAAREARAAALGRSLREHVAARCPCADLPARRDLLDALAPAARAALEAPLGLLDLPPAPPPAPAARVSLAALRAFLECPLQAWGRHRLGLADADGEDALAREDEPFALENPLWTVLLRQAFWDGAAAPGPGPVRTRVEAAYEARARTAELQGKAPTGFFAGVQRARDLAILARWAAALEGRGALDAAPVRLGGEAAPGDATTRAAPPLVLDCGGAGPDALRVEVHGTTRPLRRDGRGLVALSATGGGERLLVELFVDHAVLLAAGVVAPGPGFELLLASGAPDAGEPRAHALTPPLTPDEARAWLGGLARELVREPHAYLLPQEAALPWAREVQGAHLDDLKPLAERIEARAADTFSEFSSSRGPVPSARALRPPPDAEERARRRFGPYVARVLDDGGEAGEDA